jgi:anaerobic selenocysteine-containing dehydrogenase
VIVAEGLHDQDYLDRYRRFRQLHSRLDEYPPQRVAEIAGRAHQIVELARAFATTHPAAIL